MGLKDETNTCSLRRAEANASINMMLLMRGGQGRGQGQGQGVRRGQGQGSGFLQNFLGKSWKMLENLGKSFTFYLRFCICLFFSYSILSCLVSCCLVLSYVVLSGCCLVLSCVVLCSLVLSLYLPFCMYQNRGAGCSLWRHCRDRFTLTLTLTLTRTQTSYPYPKPNLHPDPNTNPNSI